MLSRIGFKSTPAPPTPPAAPSPIGFTCGCCCWCAATRLSSSTMWPLSDVRTLLSVSNCMDDIRGWQYWRARERRAFCRSDQSHNARAEMTQHKHMSALVFVWFGFVWFGLVFCFVLFFFLSLFSPQFKSDGHYWHFIIINIIMINIIFVCLFVWFGLGFFLCVLGFQLFGLKRLIERGL